MPVEVQVINDSDDQWDVLQTIEELRHLEEHTTHVVNHTIKKMGMPAGIAPDGTEVLEHPLGRSIWAIRDTLEACYRKYGRDMYLDAQMMDDTFITRTKRDARGRFTQ